MTVRTLGALIEDQDRLIFLIVQNKPGIDDVFMVLDLKWNVSRRARGGLTGESDARRGEGDQGWRKSRTTRLVEQGIGSFFI